MSTLQLLVFSLQGQRHAVPLAGVERVLAAAAVTPLPQAPHAVLGAIDFGGRILPVYDLRRRFGMQPRPLAPADQFLLVRTPRRALVLVVDEVHGIAACEQPAIAAASLVPGLATAAGVVRLDDGLLLIHDLERLLSPSEEQALAAAMEARA